VIVDTAGVGGYRLASGDRKNSVNDVEENIYIQITTTAIYEATDINPGNNESKWCEIIHLVYLNKEFTV
jgi:hypothetical protein